MDAGAGADGVAYDQGTETAFRSNGEGTMTVVRQVNGKYAVVQTVTTERGARTVVVDPATHRVYTPTASFGPASAGPGKRPSPLPGTFHVVVVSR